MTRHQRRKAAKAKSLAATRREIVRSNLGTPSVRERTEHLISPVYGNSMDVARGRGVTPATHRVTRIISASPYAKSLGPAASTVKMTRDESREIHFTVTRAQGCGWDVIGK
jgi:hypothetical protein